MRDAGARHPRGCQTRSVHRAPTLFALLTLALTGCPDAPTPTTTPSPLPQPRTSGSLTPGLPSTSAPTTTPAPTTAASPPPGLRTIVYRKHGEPVVGELRSEPDDDPVVLSTEHGEVSLPRSLIRYVRQPGDPPPRVGPSA